ncbi:putative FAD-dependent oxidoreductase [Actinoplanes missouriensis 431]|uniref:Putative FAD-dependent oxidoreductase n=1 Tax=Actinoplanes missouriensis (strain ATCC 14538 / DSM 43046 / CBS 188.64 / JCM 3121 / NBRC 102363 / NCIMB 12654 / NRRL B-3342 / UNCC 431) TaxID=512565 RepID=I0GZP0_ACTM4|nr:FAD-binding protein [Actinoplanes missouriensis]BAL86227.1 putative FAD-dependent oxidoreductase [Actinoplanes missouriensis 431]
MREQLTNWAGNIVFGTDQVHRPKSVAEVQEVVASAAGRLRVLGSGHSFNRLADTTGALISLADLPRTVEIGPDRTSVRVDGGLRYGDLAAPLSEAGLAVHNLASLPHISVAGAVATATHGSGVRNGNLATAVSGLEIVRADGELVTLTRADADLAGAVVGLGALGVVTALTLDVSPAFDLRQYVYENLPAAALDDALDEILADGYSVSLFTRWTGPGIDQVWLKRHDPMPAGDFHGATLAGGPRHPVPGMPAENCTEQGGVPGPWHARLPHFRMEFTPSSGEELQSEWHVPRQHARAAIAAVAELRERVAAVLQVCEMRTIAADELWLSPNHRRDSLALHFTWIADTEAVLPVVADVERALAPFAARPHWGKIFTTAQADLRAAYPRFGDFAELVRRFDAKGTFRNEWLDGLLG